MLALQRGPALLELVDLASGMCFVHSTHLGRGSILAFFFTDAPDTDFVVVTTRAVELNQFAERWVRDKGPFCGMQSRGWEALKLGMLWHADAPMTASLDGCYLCSEALPKFVAECK